MAPQKPVKKIAELIAVLQQESGPICDIGTRTPRSFPTISFDQ